MIQPDGTAAVNLTSPIYYDYNVTGQDNDFSMFYTISPRITAHLLIDRLEWNPDNDAFIVIRFQSNPTVGVSGRGPLVGYDEGDSQTPANGNSFFSLDGQTFLPETRFNFMGHLVVGETH